MEQKDVEDRRDLSSTVTPSSAEAESRAQETLSPSVPQADESVFLNAADCMHTDRVKKAVLLVQRSSEEPEELWEQEQCVDKKMGAKTRVAEAESLAYASHSPRANGLLLLDTAQYLAASAEGTGSPGPCTNS